MAVTKPRLQYFDMLKGLAIFMVVMGHVLTMCVREIDRTALFKFIGAVHMPLFFFISGWMTWRADGRGAGLGKRAMQLLVPMVAMSTLWIFYFPHSGLESPLNSSFAGLWGDEWKNGYWFTLVLFEIIAVYSAMRPALARCHSFVAEAGMYAAVWCAMLIFGRLCGAMAFYSWFSFGLATQFFPVFAIGAMAHRHSDAFNRITESSAHVTAAMIIGGAALYMVCWPWEFAWLTAVPFMLVTIVLHICLAIVAIAVTRPWSAEAFGAEAPAGGRPLARMWAYIGRESLAIYLLHYFFLFPLGAARGMLTATGLAFVPAAVFSAAVAAAVVGAVLCVNRLLRPSEPLSWLMCGRLPRKNLLTNG